MEDVIRKFRIQFCLCLLRNRSLKADFDVETCKGSKRVLEEKVVNLFMFQLSYYLIFVLYRELSVD